jgi:nicotinate-nucleotide--dimethylbenzimidazole phosphoribosyltransferase
MALPVAVTGAGGGEVSWLPPPAEPEPVVVEPDAPDEPAAAGAAPLDEPPLDDLPSTATELPVALTGAAAGKASWLPPPAEPEPVVEPDDPDEPAAAGAAAAEPLDEPLLDDLPSTATELPVALTGAVAGEASWLPPPAEPEPVVVEPDDPDEPVAAGAAAAEPLLDDLPSTATELPVAVTGAVAGEVSWLPPPAEPEPVVVEPDESVAAGAAAAEPLLDELPSTATELPVAVTGTAGAATTWFPPAALCDPVVLSAADACPAKNRTPPPTMRATSRPLRRYACMI